jgi:hypothetical protein
MGADSVLVYYGIRFRVAKESDFAALQRKTDPRVVQARAAGLSTWFGQFATGTDDDDELTYFLYVGEEIGVFGAEGISQRELDDERLAALMTTTKARLAAAGFSVPPVLYINWEPDF